MRIHTHTHTHTHTRAHVHTHAHTHARAHTHTHTCARTHARTHTHTHTHTHARAHTHTHTHTHTLKCSIPSLFQGLPPPGVMMRGRNSISVPGSQQLFVQNRGSMAATSKEHQRSMAIQVDIPSDSSSSSDTCRLPSLKRMGQQLYKYTIGK